MDKPYLFTGFSILLFLYFVFFFQYSFNYEVGLSHYYLLYFIVAITVLLTAFMILHPNRINTILIFVAALLLCLFLFSDYYTIANEHYAVMLLLYIAVIAGSGMMDLRGLHALLWAFLLVFIIQVGFGGWQLLTAETGQKEKGYLYITGTLHNSGIYSCYLLASLPFAYYLIKRKWVFWVLSLPAGLLICYTLSRTAIISGLVLLIVFYYPLLKSRKLLLIMVGLTGLALAIYLKLPSAIGRALTWEVTLSHWKDHFWFGTGLGRFTWYYPQWQAAWFRQNHPSASYIACAGETYIIFNEYLQLFKEVGLPGSLLILFAGYKFFTVRIAAERQRIVYAARLTGLVIVIASLTSYPLHSTPLLFLLFTCIGIVCREAMTKGAILHTTCMLMMSCLSLSVIIYAYNRLSRLPISGEFTSAYPYFKKDGKFLALYAADQVNYKNAAATYEQSMQYFINKDIVTSCAVANRLAGNYARAAYHYKWLIYYLPAQFQPKFELLQLYESMGKKDSIYLMAKEIDTMPVKIPSSEVNDIKLYAKRILDDFK